MAINVTVVCETFNEEARIERFLHSFSWASRIIIVDKSSEDQTASIARSRGAEVITVPYSVKSFGAQKALDDISFHTDFILFGVASEFCTSGFAEQLASILGSVPPEVESIRVPFKHKSFGMYIPHSPFNQRYKEKIFRVGSFIVSDRIHNELKSKSKNIFTMKNQGEFLVHDTHLDLDDTLIKHLRYSAREAEIMKQHSMPALLFYLTRSSYQSFLRTASYLNKKSFLMGLIKIHYHLTVIIRVIKRSIDD